MVGWYNRLLSTLNEPAGSTDAGTESKEPVDMPMQARLRASCNQSIIDKWQSMSWHVAIFHPWSTDTHNNVLELEAALLPVRHLQRSSRTRLNHVSLFLDSTALGALAKGRSSSFSLNAVCRNLAVQLSRGKTPSPFTGYRRNCNRQMHLLGAGPRGCAGNHTK